MKRLIYLLFIVFITSGLAAQDVFITEIHYDNAGGDVGEFVEVFITNPQPSNLNDYVLTLYNGSNGTSYDSETFDNADSTNPNQTNGFGTGTYYVFYIAGIQNGAPDGLSTSNSSGVFEFLSYEGTLTAANGPANGMTSTNIGASETSSTGVGTSMQNNGTGTWNSGLPETPGENNQNDILPVEFTTISATKSDRGIDVQWQTATELNNEKFEVEASRDGVEFKMIGEVKGAGNSQKLIDYSFVDRYAANGVNYYRVKQVDFDGKYAYSQVVSVSNSRTTMTIAPTASYSYIYVQTAENSEINVYSMNGQLMTNQKNVDGQYTIDMTTYPKGIYYLSALQNGELTTERIIKM